MNYYSISSNNSNSSTKTDANTNTNIDSGDDDDLTHPVLDTNGFASSQVRPHHITLRRVTLLRALTQPWAMLYVLKCLQSEGGGLRGLGFYVGNVVSGKMGKQFLFCISRKYSETFRTSPHVLIAASSSRRRPALRASGAANACNARCKHLCQ